MTSRIPSSFTRALLALALAGFGGPARAVDADNCLMCHRFRGLARVEKDGRYRLFYVDEALFNRGPHARLSCKGCHADIEKIPHDRAQPVDCLRNCHIEEPNREIIFTHALVDEILSDSVHARGSAPREAEQDFPRCKDCHDEPLFRPVAIFKQARAGVSERALGRCAVCHTDERFTRYFYDHVTTRLHKARDPREVVAMCGRCHADPALARRHNLPDVVSSYLETYHGKAVMFGSRRAPDCMDCHVKEGDSVHAMHSRSDPRSSVHPANAAATCATAECHPNATASLASFDVHADRDPRSHPLEFGVALFFVLATLGILLPILTLSVMGLVRELFPSRAAEEEIDRLAALAEERAGRNGGIQRFAAGARIQHWFLVACFLVLCLTGFPLRFPQAPWAPYLLDAFGGIERAPIFHRIAGVALIAGFAFHVALLARLVRRSLAARGERGAAAWIREIRGLPMFPSPRDLGELVAWVKYVFFLSPRRPLYGRFSWKEKLEYLGLFWGIPLLGITGALLWAEEIASHILPGWVLTVAYLAHTYESFLAAAHILLVHIPSVIGRPGATPITGMLVAGTVAPRVYAEEHGGEIEALDPAAEAEVGA